MLIACKQTGVFVFFLFFLFFGRRYEDKPPTKVSCTHVDWPHHPLEISCGESWLSIHTRNFSRIFTLAKLGIKPGTLQVEILFCSFWIFCLYNFTVREQARYGLPTWLVWGMRAASRGVRPVNLVWTAVLTQMMLVSGVQVSNIRVLKGFSFTL